MKRLKLTVTFLLTILLVASGAGIAHYALNQPAQQPKQPEPVIEATDVNLEFKSKDVFVFKNGIGLVLKSGKVSDFDGTAVAGDVPDALMGSIITYVDDKDAKIKGVTAYKKTAFYENDITSLDALINKNVGKKVKVSDFNKEFVTGTLKMAGVDFIIVVTGEENVFIKKTNIRNMSVLDEVDTKVKSSTEVRRLKFEIESAKKEMDITLGYLRRGIRWIPLYKVDLLTDNKAKITMDAQIVNDGEDIEDANFHLIVGAPNFRFSELENPFSIRTIAERAIRDSRRSRSGRFSNVNLSNALMSQSASFGNVVQDFEQPSGDFPEEIGVKNEDTFVYEMKNITLKKGERMMVNIFEAEVEYEDVYKVDLVDDFTSATGYVSSSSRSSDQDDELTKNKVWHNLRLKNTTNVPWTTGVGTVFKSNVPISQDILKYTPSGIECDLTLMIASDIFVQEDGRETKREKGTGHYYWSSYFDKVTVEADISITNAKDKAVKIEVTKTFYGDEVWATIGAEISKSAKYLLRVNPSSLIKWKVSLGKKESVKLDYGFTTWVKR